MVRLSIKHARTKKTDTERLVNRPWWSASPPEAWTDPFSLYCFSDHQFGDDENELFAQYMNGVLARYVTITGAYKACPANMSVRWVAQDETTKTRYKIVKEKNGEFDLKMTLETDPWVGGRSRVFFSKEEWEFESLDFGKFLKLKR